MGAPPGSVRMTIRPTSRNIEGGLHDLGARLRRLFYAGVDVVDGDVGHPAFGGAAIGLGDPGDRLAVGTRNHVGAPSGIGIDSKVQPRVSA